MMRRARYLIFLVLSSGALLTSAADSQQPAASDGTAAPDAGSAFSQPVAGLGEEQSGQFAEGRAEFQQRWVAPFSIGGNWGRGPTFNAEMCADCHAGNGRGRPLETIAGLPNSMVVRLSLAGDDGHGGPRPHPAYGIQLQEHGELGAVPAEGEALLEWSEIAVSFADGEQARLRTPRVKFQKLAFGPLGPETMTSLRIAPPVFGMGLLEAVPEEALLDIARTQAARGYHGRLNYVWDGEKQAPAPGRFGWKANQPTLRQQIALAFLEDMGVTTRLFPRENCPPVQVDCVNRRGVASPEQQDRPFDALVFYVRMLGAPERRDTTSPEVLAGERIFSAAQCDVCHVPQLRSAWKDSTGRISKPIIHPYTDLLLHDMGEGLADGRPDYRAGKRDWRTAPLWGLGLNRSVNGNAELLHDGRARNPSEAILWHGGEAATAREAFLRMPRAEREALLAFLNSL